MATSPVSTLTAAAVMTASPRTCSVCSTITEAVMLLHEVDCGAIPIVDAGQPIGILTADDVERADNLGMENQPVTDIMLQSVATILPDAPIDEVETKVREHPAHRLLVVDATGQLQGIITPTDLASRSAG